MLESVATTISVSGIDQLQKILYLLRGSLIIEEEFMGSWFVDARVFLVKVIYIYIVINWQMKMKRKVRRCWFHHPCFNVVEEYISQE